jgi:hypothetical protein
MVMEAINKLIFHWKKCNVYLPPEESFLMDYRLGAKNMTLPEDFKVLYRLVNGTSDWDNIAFVFYGIQRLITMGSRFSLSENDPLGDVIIFADYMDESWWYGVKLTEDGYNIGIIPTEDRFKAITTSLTDFIHLYLTESDKLSDYS